jgi:dipeptidyl aminopeptidase/acylaminoacyl peptidase
LVLVLVVASSAAADGPGYTERRHAFETAVHEPPLAPYPAPAPPAGMYERIKYPAPLGKNTAYVTPVVKDGRKRPAIVWIQGGFDWSVDDSAWKPAPRSNDQSARAFREAGMVEMLPSLRGCNDNPGEREYFLGEVDDVLAAIEFVRKRPDVDPERVYLGGHSTGATLALLVAASRPPVRAVFAFGPIAWIKWYGKTGTALDSAAVAERTIRSPAAALADATAPVFVIEGERGNVSSFEQLRINAGKAPVRFFRVRGADHFSDLAPVSELIATRVVREAEGGPAFDLTESELAGAVAAH